MLCYEMKYRRGRRMGPVTGPQKSFCSAAPVCARQPCIALVDPDILRPAVAPHQHAGQVHCQKIESKPSAPCRCDLAICAALVCLIGMPQMLSMCPRVIRTPAISSSSNLMAIADLDALAGRRRLQLETNLHEGRSPRGLALRPGKAFSPAESSLPVDCVPADTPRAICQEIV
jgi:hypothetical protein